MGNDRFSLLHVAAILLALTACSGFGSSLANFEVPDDWNEIEVWSFDVRRRFDLPNVVLALPKGARQSEYPSGIQFDDFRFFHASERRVDELCEHQDVSRALLRDNELVTILLRCPAPIERYHFLFKLFIGSEVFYIQPNWSADEDAINRVRLSLLNARIRRD